MHKIYRNWFVHNMIGHPLSEIVYWVVFPFGAHRATDASGWVHDKTLPLEVEENGRG